MPKKICDVLAVASRPPSSSLSTRKFAAPLKSSSPGRQLPVAVINSLANWSYGLLYWIASRRYCCMPARSTSERRSIPPVRPINRLDQTVVQFRPNSSAYSSPKQPIDQPLTFIALAIGKIGLQFIDRRHAAQQVQIHAPTPFAIGRGLRRNELVVAPAAGNRLVDQPDFGETEIVGLGCTTVAIGAIIHSRRLGSSPNSSSTKAMRLRERGREKFARNFSSDGSIKKSVVFTLLVRNSKQLHAEREASKTTSRGA